MLVKTYAGVVLGVNAQIITIEINAGGNVPAATQWYHLVGLPDSAVREGYHLSLIHISEPTRPY